ncbi:MAG: Ig-like domain-containing protein [Chitinophagales bacterium]|nr:Ig-like domain-containing protein [Chitinophagales bacterium]
MFNIKSFLNFNLTTIVVRVKLYIPVILFFIVFISCKKDTPVESGNTLQVSVIQAGITNLNLTSDSSNVNVPTDQPLTVSFNQAIDTASAASSISLSYGGNNIPLQFSFLNENKTISIMPSGNLINSTFYTLEIRETLKGANGGAFTGSTVSFTTVSGTLKILSIIVSGKNLFTSGRVTDVNRSFSAVVQFNHSIDPSSISPSTVSLFKAGQNAPLTFSFIDSNKTLIITSSSLLVHFDKYTLYFSNQLKGTDQFSFAGYSKEFYTSIDSTPKFPLLSDDDLLTKIQEQTFTYFWDFAHPVSGLARERENSGNLVTIGGSGFGVMAILVGINRNFITRQEGIDRLEKIVNFLTVADRFHGAFPHWMDGTTGKVIPFSPNDNGGDLVETAYLMQGLLTVRQFLDPFNTQENGLITKINALWNTVEWDWYTQGGQNVLYWHWSPDKGWILNVQIGGYDEALITYILAAASPTHTIDKAVYTNGWARNGGIINGRSYYGFTLPLGESYGGPLFFAHYSFLGFDPRNLKDQYADYWMQNVNHTQINRGYCIDNPLNYVGYSYQDWGLTASDDPDGYDAHSPTNDNGTISPTAAISSIPYTPQYSMDALKFFYYTLGDKLWGPYGFYDAFNSTDGWYGTSDLAIDEGPIIVMIENYRSAMLWDLFMSCPEVSVAIDKLDFTN